jgi:thioesterase domain-containing protein
MWGAPEDWQDVRERLEARGIEVLVPDLPSHRLAGAGLLDDAEAVRAAIRAANSSPTVGVGWSYGCDALGIAADGESVSRLVYVGSVPHQLHPEPRESTFFDDNPVLVWDGQGRCVPREGWWNDADLSPEARAFFEAHPRRPVTRMTLSDPIPAAAWTHLPTTVLLGERDLFNGEQPWARARELVEDVRVLDSDHFVPFSLPALVAEVILERIPGRA